MKKAQGQIFWIIIAAALALMILVVLSIITGKGFGGFSKETSCEARGGECMSSAEAQEKCPATAKSFTLSCPEDDEVCCLESLLT